MTDNGLAHRALEDLSIEPILTLHVDKLTIGCSQLPGTKLTIGCVQLLWLVATAEHGWYMLFCGTRANIKLPPATNQVLLNHKHLNSSHLF